MLIVGWMTLQLHHAVSPAWHQVPSLACTGRDSTGFEGPEEPHGLLLHRHQHPLHPRCPHAYPEQGGPLHRMALWSCGECYSGGGHTRSENFSNIFFLLQKKIEEGLKELRDMAVFYFAMFNALFVLIVFMLTLNKDVLHIDWPFGIKENITITEANEVWLKPAWLHETEQKSTNEISSMKSSVIQWSWYFTRLTKHIWDLTLQSALLRGQLLHACWLEGLLGDVCLSLPVPSSWLFNCFHTFYLNFFTCW